jgi:TfoX/Sxy family transcriptional regulator of competence genes
VEIPKPSEDDKQFFRSLIADDPEVEVKPMFGNLGAFVHGNMFAGLFGSAVGVRLAEPDARELAAVEGSGPFGPEGHAMSGYTSLPASWRSDADLAASWVERARDHVGTLPPKAAKPRKAAKPKTVPS